MDSSASIIGILACVVGAFVLLASFGKPVATEANPINDTKKYSVGLRMIGIGIILAGASVYLQSGKITPPEGTSLTTLMLLLMGIGLTFLIAGSILMNRSKVATL